MSDVTDAVKLDALHNPLAFDPGDGFVTLQAGEFVEEGDEDRSGGRWRPVEIEAIGTPHHGCWARRRLIRKHDPQATRIASLEAENAALQTELDSLRAIMDSEHETFLQELILTAYGNAPFGTDHAKVIADAKAMLQTMEGGAA